MKKCRKPKIVTDEMKMNPEYFKQFFLKHFPEPIEEIAI